MFRIRATAFGTGSAARVLPRLLLRSTTSATAVTDAQSSTKIELPKKKQRDEFSVLRALAGTVSMEPTSPRYWFIDDPMLVPRSRVQQRLFALSRASGRKAARYLMNKYDRKFGAFSHEEPRIDALSPSPLLAVAEKQDEDGLNALIELRRVKDAHTLYLLLVKDGGKLSMKTQLRLLDAICAFGNDMEAGERDYRLEPEERWYLKELSQTRNNTKGRDPLRLLNQWQNDGPAEQLFARILEQLNVTELAGDSVNVQPEQAAADASSTQAEESGKAKASVKLDAEARQALTCALQAIIRGAAKSEGASRVLELLAVCRRFGIVPDLATYNAAINVLAHSRFDTAQRVDNMMALMKEMHAHGVRPSVETFNAALHVISTLRYANEQSVALASKTLREMQLLDIKPSLATWARILNIFYPSSGSRSTILYGIMDRLEEEARQSGEPFQVREPTDLDFFSTAMQRCVACLHDPILAQRIDKLLRSNGNAPLIGNGLNEIHYSSSYFRLMLAAESIDKAMNFYEEHVPHAWQPSRIIYHTLLDTIDIYKAFKYLPRIWDDLTTGIENGTTDFEPDLVRRIIKSTAEAMTNAGDTELRASLLKFLTRLRAFANYDRTKRAADATRGRLSDKARIDADICSSAIVIALNANEYELARAFFLEYRELAPAKSDSLAGSSSNSLSDEAYGALLTLRKRLPELEKQAGQANAAKNARKLLDSITDSVDVQALERVERKLAVKGNLPGARSTWQRFTSSATNATGKTGPNANANTNTNTGSSFNSSKKSRAPSRNREDFADVE